MLTIKESVVKDFMVRRFIPSMHEIFRNANPDQYERWGGNCCRQAAVFGKLFLDELLPEYEWEGWDGIFDDKIKGKNVQYNHAWLYGIHKEEDRKLLVDLSRMHQDQLFITTKKNKYPRSVPSYRHTRCRMKEKMDIEMLMMQHEFYTALSSGQLLEKFKRTTKFNSFKENLLLVKGSEIDDH